MFSSAKTKCTLNVKSPVPHRNYYDYTNDIPDSRLAENDVLRTEFSVDRHEPLEPPESIEDAWAVILLHGLNSDSESMDMFVGIWRYYLPEVTFFCPNATSIPVTMNMHMEMPAWHDIFEVGSESVPEKGWPQMAHSVTRIRKQIYSLINEGYASDHIILSGFSQGGHLAFATAFNSNIPLGAVVSFSGFYSNPNHENAVQEIQQAKNRNIPIWMGHGTSDSVILYKASKCSYDALVDGGAKVYHVQYQGMEHIYNEMCIKDAGEWIRLLIDGDLPRRSVVLQKQTPSKKK